MSDHVAACVWKIGNTFKLRFKLEFLLLQYYSYYDTSEFRSEFTHSKMIDTCNFFGNKRCRLPYFIPVVYFMMAQWRLRIPGPSTFQGSSFPSSRNQNSMCRILIQLFTTKLELGRYAVHAEYQRTWPSLVGPCTRATGSGLGSTLRVLRQGETESLVYGSLPRSDDSSV